MTFMAVQIYNWPWKAPILNVVDMVICFLLAILVVVAGFYVPVASGGLLNFFEIFSMVVFALLFGVVAYLHMPQWSSGLVDTFCCCNTAFQYVGVSELLAIRQRSTHTHRAFDQQSLKPPPHLSFLICLQLDTDSKFPILRRWFHAT